ncbi:hypothetical protein B0H13DRAFT_2373548 [Mycena leptocephala]|nr:hypothetical protein B0H13DRAFT_2373548 [Mycena leptocephala]
MRLCVATIALYPTSNNRTPALRQKNTTFFATISLFVRTRLTQKPLEVPQFFADASAGSSALPHKAPSPATRPPPRLKIATYITKKSKSFYDEDEYAQSVCSAASNCDFTPTPAPTCGASPASVVELDPRDLPAPTTPTQASKASCKLATPEPTTDDEPVTGAIDANANDPFLAADIALATTDPSASPLYLTMHPWVFQLTPPASAAGSPAKRVHTNTAGDAALAPLRHWCAHLARVHGSPCPHQEWHLAAPSPLPFRMPSPLLPCPALLNTRCRCRPAPGAAIAAGAVWMTADGNPPWGSYTPTPAGGYPDIVYSPTLLWQGVPDDLCALYVTVANPEIFPSVGSYINIASTDFQLGTLSAIESGPAPTLWLVLSSTRITIFPVPYEMPVNGFISTYGGLTFPDTGAGAAAAQRLFQDAARANGAFDTFVASVHVHALRLTVNDVDTIAWQLHVTSPTNNYTTWNLLCHLFHRINLMTALHGTAYLLHPFHCHICPSVAHPTTSARSPQSLAGSAQPRHYQGS